MLKIQFIDNYWNKEEIFNNVIFTNKTSEITICRDTRLNEGRPSHAKIAIAWLNEPPEILDFYYNNKDILNQFDIIISHHKQFINELKNGLYVSYGGCWIKNPNIYEKNKNISAIISDKKYTKNHKLRHVVAEIFNNQIDLYGTAFKELEYPYKDEGLVDYRYSIVIENQTLNGFFTEKLIDCFATGTIPIYMGDPEIGKIFDNDGIIQFQNIEQLYQIFENLNEKNYNDRIEHIKNNFKLHKKFNNPLMSISNSQLINKIKKC